MSGLDQINLTVLDTIAMAAFLIIAGCGHTRDWRIAGWLAIGLKTIWIIAKIN